VSTITDTHYKSFKDLPTEHLLAPGSSMCAGCGGLAALKQAYDVLGPKSIFINAAGCMTLLAAYPAIPLRSSWLYTAMGAAPAGAQGVRDALDILMAKGRLDPEEDLRVVVLSGDGSASGIGMSATSGALDRGLDFLYLCYDNEGFGNTGQQSSPLTPLGARTTTARGPEGYPRHKKDLFAVWTAHRPAYAATVLATEPLDLARKIEKALTFRGPKMILSLAPCPTGWRYDPKLTVEIGRLAVKTGVWPLKEYVDGEVVHTKVPKTRLPVERYLEVQGRFRHLFTPERNEALLARIQLDVDRYWFGVASW
jgi:pyruvate ferredoxin oxidoreductase beta subunit